jgi:hypothetical protein
MQEESVNEYRKYGFKKVKVVKIESYLRGDLAERIEAFRGRELPGFLNFSLFTRLMGEYVNLWAEPVEKFRASVSKALLFASEKFIKEDAMTKNFTRLSCRLVEEIQAFVGEQDVDAIEKLKQLRYMELLPSTENHYLWDTINKIRNDRSASKIMSMTSDHEGFVSKDSVIAMLKSDLGNQSNESAEVDDTIDFLAAYWKLAVKRFIDTASMIIASTYTRPECVKLVEYRLTNELVSKDPESLVRMFRQDESIKRRREELVLTIDRLEQAKKRMDRGFD